MTRLEKLKALATEEAVKLKQSATKEEIGNLNIVDLDPDDRQECIYGQMTGYCYSERALNLIQTCCSKVYEPVSIKGRLGLTNSRLIGKPYDIKPLIRGFKYHSPIECLIIDPEAGHEASKKLIAFLKDETQTLEL